MNWSTSSLYQTANWLEGHTKFMKSDMHACMHARTSLEVSTDGPSSLAIGNNSFLCFLFETLLGTAAFP